MAQIAVEANKNNEEIEKRTTRCECDGVTVMWRTASDNRKFMSCNNSNGNKVKRCTVGQKFLTLWQR